MDEHDRLLNYYSLNDQEVFVLCNHVKISNEQLVNVREAGRAEQGEACKQAAPLVLGS